MNVNVLRLDHRLKRDKRITTHVCLTARAFGASKIYLAGEEDHRLMENVRDIVNRWGGDFEVEYSEGLYLDCNKEGKQSKPQQDYRLFRFKDGKVRLLDMVIDGKQDWAPELWAAVEDEF